MVCTAISACALSAPFAAGCRPWPRLNRSGLTARCNPSGGSPRASSQNQPAGGREVAPRREALRVLLAGLALSGLSPLASRAEEGILDVREGDVRHTEAEWRALLSPGGYAVLREAATEQRFTSPLLDEHRKGTFVCAGCAAPLFASSAKYSSGTGWPSFTDALPGAVDYRSDDSILFMPRTEVRCHKCQGHLGHVFEDGPPPTNTRYCMNGVALGFVPDEA